MQSTGAVPQPLARPIALGGLVFFVDALLYFAYRYNVVFAREQTGTTSIRAVTLDMAFFTVFALHHSLFARDAIRKRVTRMVGALERSLYVWIASALLIAVCAWWQPVAGVAWRIDQPAVVWFFHAAQVVGAWLSIRSAMLIDLLELAGVKQLRRRLPDPSHPQVFKASGPYGWVRHPIYSGWFLLVFAVPVMTTTQLVFAAASSGYLLIAIPFEERSLRVSSSGAYDKYMREVPWKLVPRIF